MKMFKKIYIEISNRCNLSCGFCSEVLKQKRTMSIEEFSHIIKEIKPYTDNIYLHVKGEPLLHPNIIEILKIAEKYDIKVNITTNGILFPSKVESLSQCKALNKINFSLHCENKVPNYIENILKAVDKLPPNITVIYRLWTLHNGILDKKSQEIVKKLANYYNLSPEIVDKIKDEKNIKISSTIYVDKDNEFEWPEISAYQSCGYCYALKTHLAILCDGTVVPCCLDSNGCIELGNIYEQSLDDIMKSKRYLNLKKSFQDRKPSELLCKSCKFKERLK